MLPLILYTSNFACSLLWLTVSKALARSRKAAITGLLMSTLLYRNIQVIKFSASLVLLSLRKRNCLSDIILIFMRKLASLACMIFFFNFCNIGNKRYRSIIVWRRLVSSLEDWNDFAIFKDVHRLIVLLCICLKFVEYIFNYTNIFCKFEEDCLHGSRLIDMLISTV